MRQFADKYGLTGTAWVDLAANAASIRHYTTLAAAVADINTDTLTGGADATGAVCQVWELDGMPVVRLLADVELSTRLLISMPAVLDLNGHTITRTALAAHNEATAIACTAPILIYGVAPASTENELVRSTIACYSSTGSDYAVCVDVSHGDDSPTILCGVRLAAESSYRTRNLQINANLEAYNCEVALLSSLRSAGVYCQDNTSTTTRTQVFDTCVFVAERLPGRAKCVCGGPGHTTVLRGCRMDIIECDEQGICVEGYGATCHMEVYDSIAIASCSAVSTNKLFGINCSSGSHLVARGCEIRTDTRATATTTTNAIYGSGTVYLRDCYVEALSQELDAYSACAVNPTGPQTLIKHCTILGITSGMQAGNNATSPDNCIVYIEDSTLTSIAHHGGLYVAGSTAYANNCAFTRLPASDEYADNSNGAVFCSYGGALYAFGCDFNGGPIAVTSTHAPGGTVYLSDCTCENIRVDGTQGDNAASKLYIGRNVAYGEIIKGGDATVVETGADYSTPPPTTTPAIGAMDAVLGRTRSSLAKTCRLLSPGDPMPLDGALLETLAGRLYLLVKAQLQAQPEVETYAYLESSGTQYINLEYIPTANTEITIACDLSINDQSTTAICGARRGIKDMAYALWIVGGVLRSDYDTAAVSLGLAAADLSNTIIRQAGPAVYINDALIYTNAAAEISPGCSLYLFACNTSGTPNTPLIKCRIKWCEIKEAGELVGRYVPALEGGEAGLRNELNGEFHENKGTGDFILGR